MKTILLQIGGAELGSLLIIGAICILIFLALRALMLWYWKVDKILQQLEMQTRIASETRDLIRKQVNGSANASTVEDKAKAYDAMQQAK